ncbi:MAG: thioredoxin [Planctomycetota bacterium]|jgi:thioredoxin 1|nr:thioredoxin [Planctomycetota bacterium]
MADAIIELADDAFAAEVATGVTLVEFYGTYCPSCRLLEPALDRIAGTYRGRAKIARINVDEYAGAAVDHMVSDIPTLVFYRDGAEEGRMFGAQKEETLAAELERLLA